MVTRMLDLDVFELRMMRTLEVLNDVSENVTVSFPISDDIH